MTTTDRLLADLIAHTFMADDGTMPNRARIAEYAAERLALAEQQAAPTEPPSADWIEEARKQAHDVFHAGFDGSLDRALDAFIAAIPRHDPAPVPPSPEPQPEEVPEEVIGLAEAEWRRVIGVGRLLPCIAQVVWSAARCYAPMPAKVTAEMVIAAGRPCGNINIAPSTLRSALQAALAAAPKDAEE